MWIEILRREVEAKGPKQVAKELDVSRAAVDLLCRDEYPAETKKMEAKIKAIYGKDGHVECPVLGMVSPLKCVETYKRAKTIGMKASNPETLRLYKTCMNCSVRSKR